MLHSTEAPKERAVLVGVMHPRAGATDLEDSLDELALLTSTAGAHVVGRLTQARARLSPATYIGSGKVEELCRLAADTRADMVVFDDDLSPVQIRNLERAIGCKLLDRSALILDIFARRAQTAVAKTQVELAQLDYLQTRLTRQWTHLSRQQGGIGTRGPGETQIETDRRLIGQRMATLRKRLMRVDRQRATQRQSRRQHRTVSLVGYTNAGKSTLLNSLAGCNVLAEDRLFATLDSTTRQVMLAPGDAVLLSDTVGFIRKLPHKLIESFKSTLDEVRASDLLLHIVSAVHSRYEDHIQVVRATLEEIGAADKPMLLVFNKMDALRYPDQVEALKAAHPECVVISALEGTGLGTLRARIASALRSGEVEGIAYIPVSDGQVVARIYRTASVLAQDHIYARGNGRDLQMVTRIRFRVPRRDADALLAMLAPYRGLEPAVQE